MGTDKLYKLAVDYYGAGQASMSTPEGIVDIGEGMTVTPESGAARIPGGGRWGVTAALDALIRAAVALRRSVNTAAKEGNADPQVQTLANSIAQRALVMGDRAKQGNLGSESAAKVWNEINTANEELRNYLNTNPTMADNPYATNIYEVAEQGVNALDTALSGYDPWGMSGGAQMGAVPEVAAPEPVVAPTLDVGVARRGPGEMMMSAPGAPVGAAPMMPGGLGMTVTPTETGAGRPVRPVIPHGAAGTPGSRQRAMESMQQERGAAAAAAAAAARQRAATTASPHNRMLKRAYAFKKLISAVKK
jgi:hypothetical protein